MAAPEFIYLVKPGVANPIRRTIPSAVGWLALGWQLADPDDAQWFVDPPAEPTVDVMTRDELDAAVVQIQADLSSTFASRWTPNTPVLAGAVRQAPDGGIVKAKANHTTGATYDANLWTIADGLGNVFAKIQDVPRARTVAASVLAPVAVPPMLANQQSSTNYPTWTSATYKNKHVTLTDATGVILVYGNYRVGVNAPDIDGAAAITVSCSIEAPDGTGNVRGFTAGGERTATIQPGGEARFFVPIELADGAYFYTRSYVSGASWPLGDVANNPKSGYGYDPVSHTSSTDNGEGANGPTGADLTGPGAAAITTSAQLTFGPVQILGTVKSGRVNVVGVFGDSIASGGLDVISVGGYERAAKTVHLPYINLARSSERASDFELQRNRETRVAYVKYITHAIVEYARNDLNNAVTLAVLQANSVALWKRLADQGVVVWHTTAPPKTTSTDGWVTLANQTVTADNAVRVLFNNWLRDGAPLLAGVAVATGSAAANTLRAGDIGHPLFDYIEVADVLESARDSGKWRVDGGRNVTVSSQANYQGIGHAAAAITNADVEASLVLPGAGAAGAIFSSTIGRVTSVETTVSNRTPTAVGSGTAVVGAARTADGTHPNAQSHKEITVALAPVYTAIKAA